MAYKISTTHQFEKDLKRCIKRGYPMDEFRTAILIVCRVRLQEPPSVPPVASFFQPTQSLDFIRPFLAMPKLKQVWLWSSGLTKTFNYRRKAHI